MCLQLDEKIQNIDFQVVGLRNERGGGFRIIRFHAEYVHVQHIFNADFYQGWDMDKKIKN